MENKAVTDMIADACERNGMLGFAKLIRGYHMARFEEDGVMIDKLKNGEGVLHVSLRMEKDDA